MFATRELTLGIAALSIAALAGCAPIDPQNTEALRLIQEYSARDAKVDNIVGIPECEIPRDRLQTKDGYPTVFKTICRVHYVEDGINRFKDMKCNGDFAKDPMLSYCYVWVPYSDNASFVAP